MYTSGFDVKLHMIMKLQNFECIQSVCTSSFFWVRRVCVSSSPHSNKIFFFNGNVSHGCLVTLSITNLCYSSCVLLLLLLYGTMRCPFACFPHIYGLSIYNEPQLILRIWGAFLRGDIFFWGEEGDL
jgi:hypothetical protein